MATDWSLLGVQLRSTAAGDGAQMVGYEDEEGSLVGATVALALDELALPVTLTAAAEAGEVIAVTVAGPAHVAQYLAELFTAKMLLETTGGSYGLSETGAGAEVSPSGEPALLFTSDANGEAVISVTDAAATSAQLYLRVTPCSVPGGKRAGGPAIISITFA